MDAIELETGAEAGIVLVTGAMFEAALVSEAEPAAVSASTSALDTTKHERLNWGI